MSYENDSNPDVLVASNKVDIKFNNRIKTTRINKKILTIIFAINISVYWMKRKPLWVKISDPKKSIMSEFSLAYVFQTFCLSVII